MYTNVVYVWGTNSSTSIGHISILLAHPGGIGLWEILTQRTPRREREAGAPKRLSVLID